MSATFHSECSEAYEVLNDSEKRQVYDTFGHAGLEQDGGGGGGPFGGQGHGEGMNMNDIFEQMFGAQFGGQGGGRGQGRGRRRGDDLQVPLRLNFFEAVYGISKQLTVNIRNECKPCNGSGAKDGNFKQCSRCGGTGMEVFSQGFLQMQQTCRSCSGGGQVAKSTCGSCRGQGAVLERQQVTVDVPAGVNTGMELRLRNKGHYVNDGERGHVNIEIAAENDPFFRRDGADVHVEIPLSLADAVLGSTVSVPTLQGEVELTVPSGSQPGVKRVMKGRGIKKVNLQASGDQYVEFKVEVPTVLTADMEDLMKQFREKAEAEKLSAAAAKYQQNLERMREQYKKKSAPAAKKKSKKD